MYHVWDDFAAQSDRTRSVNPARKLIAWRDNNNYLLPLGFKVTVIFYCTVGVGSINILLIIACLGIGELIKY